MRRPRVTMSRNGRISSGRLGPPKATSSTASYRMPSAPVGKLVDDLDEDLHVLDGRVLVDAMTEVEDVARPPAGGIQDGLRALPHICGRGQEHGGLEVPLHRDVVAHRPPAVREIHAPVEPAAVTAG